MQVESKWQKTAELVVIGTTPPSLEPEEGDDLVDVEVQDEGDDSLDEGENDREEVADDRANELEDDSEERADEATNNAEQLEEGLVDRTTGNLEDGTESLEDNLEASKCERHERSRTKRSRRTTTRVATSLPSSSTVIWAVPSTEARMTSAGWPTRASSEDTAPVRMSLISPMGPLTASTVAFWEVTNSGGIMSTSGMKETEANVLRTSVTGPSLVVTSVRMTAMLWVASRVSRLPTAGSFDATPVTAETSGTEGTEPTELDRGRAEVNALKASVENTASELKENIL